jgi:hypothetical protein
MAPASTPQGYNTELAGGGHVPFQQQRSAPAGAGRSAPSLNEHICCPPMPVSGRLERIPGHNTAWQD